MTNKELAAALRLCGSEKPIDNCPKCPFFCGYDPNVCIPKMTAACADALANSESHVAALQKEIEKLRGQIILQNDELLKLREQVPRWTPERCAELAKADRDGRLVVLPCKPLDTVYSLFCGEIVEKHIGAITINGYTNPRIWVELYCDFLATQIKRWDLAVGKEFYLTREEAEQALKEAKEDGKVH